MSYNEQRERNVSIVVEFILDGLARVHWKKGKLADADMELRRALRALLPNDAELAARQELRQRLEEVEKKTAHKPTLFDLSTRVHNQQQQILGLRMQMQQIVERFDRLAAGQIGDAARDVLADEAKRQADPNAPDERAAREAAEHMAAAMREQLRKALLVIAKAEDSLPLDSAAKRELRGFRLAFVETGIKL